MAFPKTRMRRLRASAGLRGLVRETQLHPGQLVLPMFVTEASSGSEPIATMPGVERLSIAAAVEQAREAATLGLGAVILFGVPGRRTSTALEHGRRTGSCRPRRARSSSPRPSCW
jgi:porphobilinogen synthase